MSDFTRRDFVKTSAGAAVSVSAIAALAIGRSRGEGTRSLTPDRRLDRRPAQRQGHRHVRQARGDDRDHKLATKLARAAKSGRR